MGRGGASIRKGNSHHLWLEERTTINFEGRKESAREEEKKSLSPTISLKKGLAILMFRRGGKNTRRGGGKESETGYR